MSDRRPYRSQGLPMAWTACSLLIAVTIACADGSESVPAGEPCALDASQSGENPSTTTTAALRVDDLRVRWEPLTPVPTPRIAYAAAALGGRIHVVGGLGATGQIHEAYDPESDTWYRLPDLPAPSDHGWAASLNERMYVGHGGTNRVFCYDPEFRAWAEVAQSPFRHGNTPAVAVINDRIYVAGGVGEGWSPMWDAEGDHGGVELSMYDPDTDTWTSLTPMTCARHHTVGAAMDGRMHVVGGRPGNQVCHEAYDPARDEWERLADLPTGREGMAGGVVGGWLVVVGGEGNPEDPYFLFDSVEAYDPDSDVWIRLPAMPTPRHGTFGATIGDTLFLPGGGRGLERNATNDVLMVNR